MSWFHHVDQGSAQQGQYPFGNRRPSPADASSCGGFNPCTAGPTEEAPAAAHGQRGGCCALEDLPSVSADSPPSLEKLSGSSPNAGRMRDSRPISSFSLQEQRCVLSWFGSWNMSQRERFLQDLLGKAVPGKVCTLLDSLSTLQVCSYTFQNSVWKASGLSFLMCLFSVQVQDKLPTIFECQLRLWSRWFESWREDERNHFLHMLEEQDPIFVDHFYRSVSGTAGRD